MVLDYGKLIKSSAKLLRIKNTIFSVGWLVDFSTVHIYTIQPYY